MAPWTYSGDQWIAYDNVDSITFKVNLNACWNKYLLLRDILFVRVSKRNCNIEGVFIISVGVGHATRTEGSNDVVTRH